MVEVFIKTRAGNTITVDCEDGDTIDVKKLPDKDNEECVEQKQEQEQEQEVRASVF